MQFLRGTALFLVAVCLGNVVLAQGVPEGQIAATPEENAQDEREASAGADASNPTAAVNFQDIRYRYFDLSGSRKTHSFETEGAYMIAPWLKTTNELRGVNTDKGGSYETDFEELKLKAIYLHDFKPFGIKAKLALGAEWLKDLGDFDKGTGTGSDKIAPLVGIGWIPTEKDFVITLVQYFWSYREDSLARQVSQTGPRLIYIRKLPGISGWAKADLKMVVDHKADEEFSATFEAQIGHMVSPGWGVYAEALVGDSALDTNAYDWGAGIGIRIMY